MSLPRWIRPTRAASVLAALAVGSGAELQPPCLGQQAPAPAPAPAAVAPTSLWTPLVQALRATASDGVPTVVMITSRANPASTAFRDALSQSPDGRAWARSVLFAEMPAEVYATQVKNLGITGYPTFIAYRRGKSGLEALGARNDLTDSRQFFAWIGSLGLASATAAPADRAVATTSASSPAPTAAAGDAAIQRTQWHGSAQGYASEQAPPYVPPKQPPAMPPTPPAYTPPPQQPVMMVPQPYVTPVPAPAPVYVQTQTPAMIVQQAPQQIVLAPPAPPQVTVAMAPQPVAMAPQPMQAPPNLFTQPAQAPQPMQAPQPVAYAPQPQPMMMAPQPQPMQAPQPVAYAPQPVGQAPGALMMTNPNLVARLLGTIGEHMAEWKNPRVRMAPAPAMAPAMAPVGQAPQGYAPVTAYAPAGPPMALLTPEATAFAPCNTYNAPCKYHGGPCPGPGGGYTPPPPPYPSATPQGGYAPRPAASGGFFDWFHKR